MGLSKKAAADVPGVGVVVAVREPELFHWRDFRLEMVIGGIDAPLVVEMLTYRDHLDRLLEHAGEYVIIKGDRVVEFHPTRLAHVEASFRKFGRVPFLVREVGLEIEEDRDDLFRFMSFSPELLPGVQPVVRLP